VVKERAREVLDVEVSALRRRHLPAVLRIEGKVYPRPWSAGLFLSELAQKGSRAYFVARHQGRVVGYAGVMILGDEGHITNIAVDPAYHRHRIGMRLMVSLIEESRDRGTRSMTLEVRRANAGAQAMYRKFGFQTVGVRRGYYVETGEDAYIMWAEGVWTHEYARRLESIKASFGKGGAGEAD
jgi:ribosomal-protein-alanine N-acetyltransferase